MRSAWLCGDASMHERDASQQGLQPAAAHSAAEPLRRPAEAAPIFPSKHTPQNHSHSTNLLAAATAVTPPSHPATHRCQCAQVCHRHLGQGLQAQRPQHTHERAGCHCSARVTGKRWEVKR